MVTAISNVNKLSETQLVATFKVEAVVVAEA